MNFLRAVRGPLTRSEKVKAIQSAAETEIHRQLSKEELSSLSSKFSLDGLFSNSEKVNILYIHMNDKIMIVLLVWIRCSEISSFHFGKSSV